MDHIVAAAEHVAKQRDRLHEELKVERGHVRGAVVKLDRALRRERAMLAVLRGVQERGGDIGAAS